MCIIESILTENSTGWFGNSIKDRQALQKVVQSAKCTIRNELPELESIYSMVNRAGPKTGLQMTRTTRTMDFSLILNQVFPLLESKHKVHEEELLALSREDVDYFSCQWYKIDNVLSNSQVKLEGDTLHHPHVGVRGTFIFL